MGGSAPDWRPTVLVVDDNIDARAISRMYLRAMGCRVYTAVDGVEGIARATERLPDVIVLDLEMPRLNGWDAARLLKQSPATGHIPIVALTAMHGARETSRTAGCDAFLAKPCLPELLWWEIRLLLGMEAAPTKGVAAPSCPAAAPEPSPDRPFGRYAPATSE